MVGRPPQSHRSCTAEHRCNNTMAYSDTAEHCNHVSMTRKDTAVTLSARHGSGTVVLAQAVWTPRASNSTTGTRPTRTDGILCAPKLHSSHPRRFVVHPIDTRVTQGTLLGPKLHLSHPRRRAVPPSDTRVTPESSHGLMLALCWLLTSRLVHAPCGVTLQVEELGRGKFGIVLLAQDNQSQQQVAIKCVKPNTVACR